MHSQQRKSILCPNCRKLINVDEARCPYCGTSRPGALWKRALDLRVIRGTDQLIQWIIFVNVGMYILSLFLSPSSIHLSFSPFTMLSPSTQSLFLLGATGTVPVLQADRWWTLVSATYLHGGLLHILFNMLAFRELAPVVREEYGVNRMFAIYTLGGAAGYLVSVLAGVTLTIGASAAVCSLIGAILYYGKSRGGISGQVLYRQVGAWALGIFLFGLFVPGINNWAHGGGILAGAGLGAFLGYGEKVREKLFHKVLGVGCMVITAAVLIWAVVSGILLRMSSL
jgi:membrane associated rhomboid family serine protease